ncbi:MAG: hypothetical protein K0Q47_1853 [Sedimentibacter sp.]|nr:hypothetical protein [Sedimentibacter sp.]
MSRNYMDNLSQQRTMTLAGQGRVYTTPDTAVLGRQIDRGYSVRNIIEIRTNNIEMAGSIIDSSVNAGANVVELITFDVSNREMYYQQALNMAVMNAVEKAKSISMNLGTGKNPVIVVTPFSWQSLIGQMNRIL